ncbi:hypothetical protein [Brucella intermedia]|uniref:hypothetical protein n=1 Tax=Brucella intermedia TaxID=94625 RepID=UPI0007C75C05|nr:hypothetical protein [Brucella intermedia]OAE46341.1 hypothetical protein A7J42_06045 [Brucella intermedia]
MFDVINYIIARVKCVETGTYLQYNVNINGDTLCTAPLKSMDDPDHITFYWRIGYLWDANTNANIYVDFNTVFDGLCIQFPSGITEQTTFSNLTFTDETHDIAHFSPIEMADNQFKFQLVTTYQDSYSGPEMFLAARGAGESAAGVAREPLPKYASNVWTIERIDNL